ncbi:MAG: hypothetical protein GX893_07245 [Firmicutes bacterium]|nr:hypothetical protein [Bacillota bacterium]
MTCFECRSLISEYLDNLLSAKKKEAFEAHLEDCQACRKEVKETRAAIQWLQQADADLEPPVSIRPAVISVLQKEKKKHFAPGLKQFVAAAAVFIMVLVGNIYWQNIFHVTPLSGQENSLVMEYQENDYGTNKVTGQNITEDVRRNQETIAANELKNRLRRTEPFMPGKYQTLRVFFNIIFLVTGVFFLWRGYKQRRKVGL